VQSGILRFDGHDVRELDVQHLRRQIGVVLQEAFLFRGTIRENIAAGRPDATTEQIIQAARDAGADEFIEVLPQTYDTVLEEGAANLSGGQRQRLSLARALLRQPPILILDEATSALDPDTEQVVVANLRRYARERTTIVVSHRLSTIRDADMLIVLDKGHLVGNGRHDDLIATCPIYANLWHQQHGKG
jgi:subfamily B ATP-binding cassette protein HlyB/CyaB